MEIHAMNTKIKNTSFSQLSLLKYILYIYSIYVFMSIINYVTTYPYIMTFFQSVIDTY